MKPIIILIAVAIAGAGLGVGFLNAPSISVTAQDVGVGHTSLTAPIDTAYVGFHITAVAGNQGFFKNKYDQCIFAPNEYLPAGSTIFCKLTDMQSKIVGEGSKVLATPLGPYQQTVIPIQTQISTGSLLVNNIADVTIVVQGP